MDSVRIVLMQSWSRSRSKGIGMAPVEVTGGTAALARGRQSKAGLSFV
jgi:hypothetical protein